MTNYLNKQFMPYLQSMIIRQYGFNNPCLGYYDYNEELILEYREDYETIIDEISCLAPLRQQVIDFFKENGTYIDISKDGDFNFYISIKDNNYLSEYYSNYEDCEFDCCVKLINDFSKYLDMKDWYIELTDEQKASIERGLKDVEEGRVIPHEEVMKKVKKLFKNKRDEL